MQWMTDSDRRVAVVATGAVTAFGGAAADLWRGASEGLVAIRTLSTADTRQSNQDIGGEVTCLPLPAPNDRWRERALDLAIAAAGDPMSQVPSMLPVERLGLVLGTCNAGLLSGCEWLRRDLAGEQSEPGMATLITPGGLADRLAYELGIGGPVFAVNTACASGANAIGIGADLIRSGHADAVLAGGTDALSEIAFAGFASLEALSPIPAAPYSGDRQGLSLGEGAGMLLLMRLSLAQAQNLPVIAEVAGYGLSADGYHPTAPRPDGSGAARAMTAAMRAAGVVPHDVRYINGHGTGTLKNDVAESRAIHNAMGDAVDGLSVSSTKSMIGHLLGAAGAVEAIVTIEALRNQIAPPTAGFNVRDPDCTLNYVPNRAVPLRANVAVSNNFAFGGANASLVLARVGGNSGPPPAPQVDEVVVTGLSVISPAGGTVANAWSSYANRSHAHRLIDGFRQGQVTIEPDLYLDRRARRRMDRLGMFGVVSAGKALADAGLTARTDETAGCGVIFGTAVGPMESMERFARPLLSAKNVPGDPGIFPNTVYNQAAGSIAQHLGLYGPTSTLSVGHASGTAAVHYAADLIRTGQAEVMLVTIADTITPQVVAAYAANNLLSRRNDGDHLDDGFALSEGAVSIVLESKAAARRRQANILAVISGTGFASGITPAQDGGIGLAKAMLAALDNSGLSGPAIGDVWLVAAGKSSIDDAEAAALNSVFESSGASPRTHDPKRYLGEPLGVGGALCAALAIHQWTHTTPEPALVNTSSLTGSHACLVLSPPVLIGSKP